MAIVAHRHDQLHHQTLAVNEHDWFSYAGWHIL
jgi:hypothetical protein